MLNNKIFPTVLIMLDVIAAISYCQSDWRKVTYWLAAAVLTFTVTW